MTISTRLEDFLDIERLLAVKLQQEMASHVELAWANHSKAMSAGDWDAATANAESFTLESVYPKVSEYAQSLMRAAIEFGASMAAGGGRTLISSLPLDRTVSNQSRQLGLFLKYRGSALLQNKLLQSIAQARTDEALRVGIQKDAKGTFYGNQYVDVTMYHGTYVADLLEKEGFKIKKPVNDDAFGTGIYLADHHDFATGYGDTVLKVKVDGLRVKTLTFAEYREETSSNEFNSWMEAKRKEITASTGKDPLDKMNPVPRWKQVFTSEYFKSKGLDGLHLKNGGKKDQMVVYDPAKLKIEGRVIKGDDKGWFLVVTKDVGKGVQKAEAVRAPVSFKEGADKMAQMVSGLHTSRLSGWGFIAEADMLGLTTYKLTAQLDNRTSRFCRFIHGKTFTIASAKKILDASVFADDPEDLKTLHPWPNQNLAIMESYEAMSQQQLQDRGLGTPPFHPGCRTLMVRVDYKTRLVKPPVPRTAQTLPDYTATTDTFMNMGIKLDQAKVDVWNEYMNVDPLVLLSTLSKKPISELLGKSKGMISVSRLTDIVVAWGDAKDLKVVYSAGSGVLALSPALVGTMLKSGEWDTLKATYSSFGATSALVKTRYGEVLALSEAGFLPDVGGWPAVKSTISSNLQALSEGALTADQAEGVRQVLVSTSPTSMSNLHNLGIKRSVMEQLLSKVSYSGYYAFDETGLS